MRGSILALAGGAVCLILGASDGYAGALKINCATNPGACVVNGPGSGTTTVDPSEDPLGTQNGPVGTIQTPSSTFTGDGAIDHGFQPSPYSPMTPAATISDFLGIPAGNFSHPDAAAVSPDDVVYEFDGAVDVTGDGALTIIVNTGDALSQVQFYVNGSTTPDIDTVANGPCDTSFVGGSGESYCAYTAILPTGLDTFILDYYAGTGDNPFIQAAVDGTNLVDGVPEPAALSLFGAALLGFGMLRRRKRG